MTAYTVRCAWGCGRTLTLSRKPPSGGVGCDAPACHAKHNEAAREAAEVARVARNATRRARRANPPRPVVLGEWGLAAQLGAMVRPPRNAYNPSPVPDDQSAAQPFVSDWAIPAAPDGA